MTPSGIESATLRFVTQCLKQLRHRVPPPWSSLYVRNQVPHPYKTKGKIIVLHILVSIILWNLILRLPIRQNPPHFPVLRFRFTNSCIQEQDKFQAHLLVQNRAICVSGCSTRLQIYALSCSELPGIRWALFVIPLFQRRLGSGVGSPNGPTHILHENHPSAYPSRGRRRRNSAINPIHTFQIVGQSRNNPQFCLCSFQGDMYSQKKRQP
jgi:hypothetical protein